MAGAHRVFVYGSLMSGEANHRHIAAARFCGEARTEARFTLLDLGPYPAMTARGTTTVRGEIYELDGAMLAALDAFEGHPTLYARAPIAMDDGSLVDAYLMTPERAGSLPAIDSGDWRAYQRARRGPRA
jgi:gamma-glutamylcyclotransferase (GGCT)/AIG2-like uncharacterized protein YtfP